MNDNNKEMNLWDVCQEEVELKAAQVSLAGQLIGAITVGADIVEARLDDELLPIIKVTGEPMLHGFNQWRPGENDPYQSFREAIEPLDMMGRWKGVVEHLRVILAGQLALGSLDIHGCAGFSKSQTWTNVDDLAQGLLEATYDLLDAKESDCQALIERVEFDNDELVGQNLKEIPMMFLGVEKGHAMGWVGVLKSAMRRFHKAPVTDEEILEMMEIPRDNERYEDEEMGC